MEVAKGYLQFRRLEAGATFRVIHTVNGFWEKTGFRSAVGTDIFHLVFLTAQFDPLSRQWPCPGAA